MFDNLYAHVDQKNSNKRQKLIDHLVNTAEGSKKIGDKIGFANTAYIVGLLHDIGKISKEFQEKILSNSSRHVDHSTLGGYIILNLSNDILNNLEDGQDNIFTNSGIDVLEVYDYTNILIYTIMSHHGQYDQVRDSKKKGYVYTSFERIDKVADEDLYKKVISLFLGNRIDLADIFTKGFIEYVGVIKKLMELSKDKETYDCEALGFYKGLVIRTLVSILKSADIKDTINSYETIIEEENIKELSKIIKEFERKVNEKYESFGIPNTPINKVRHRISNDILKRSKIDKNGIYKLNLPTGAGKTLLSLRYGINQLNYQNKDRFFYVTSFLSVLEQNAKEMKEVLGNNDYILEHHSNVLDKDLVKSDDYGDGFESIRKDYLLDNWSSPIIMTTMVQFFNTIFKGKSANLTRFKSLINSVIIIDECQSIPTEYLYMTNLSLNFLKVVFNANIVLSTATQPTNSEKILRHKLSYGDMDNRNDEIIKLAKDELACFKRVNLKLYKNISEEYTLDDIKELLLENQDKSSLIILNTKKVVKELYDILSYYYQEDDLYYLTTNLTAFDRIKKIKEIKDRLNRNEKICLVSTQLIEAGVDVDFELVIRSISGIDSIVQAMGRCNREGKRETCDTYVINLDSNQEKTSILKGIDERKEATRYVLRNISHKVDLDKIVKGYFKKLYANLDINDFSTTLQLLANNINARDLYLKSQKNLSCETDSGFIFEFEKNSVLNIFQSFKTAYNEFDFIKNNQNTAVIEYEASKEIINEIRDLEIEFKRSYDLKLLMKIKSLCKRLSIHSVSINNKDLDKVTSILEGMLYIVDSTYYNPKFGIDFDAENIFLL